VTSRITVTNEAAKQLFVQTVALLIVMEGLQMAVMGDRVQCRAEVMKMERPQRQVVQMLPFAVTLFCLSVCLSVCPHVTTREMLNGWLLMKFGIVEFY
jgi:hypothetical protein